MKPKLFGIQIWWYQTFLLTYRMRAIITRGLYTFYPLFDVQKRSRVFFLKILALCMISIQERFQIKSGLWWPASGIQISNFVMTKLGDAKTLINIYLLEFNTCSSILYLPHLSTGTKVWLCTEIKHLEDSNFFSSCFTDHIVSK